MTFHPDIYVLKPIIHLTSPYIPKKCPQVSGVVTLMEGVFVPYREVTAPPPSLWWPNIGLCGPSGSCPKENTRKQGVSLSSHLLLRR
jgi:hypothetical protein